MPRTPRRTPHQGDKCGAHTRKGTPCGQAAGYGTDHVGVGHCKHHGGSTPGGRIQGQRLLAEKAVAAFGLPVDVDPTTALLDEVKRTAGVVQWLDEQVRALNVDDIGWGRTRVVTAAKPTGDDEADDDEDAVQSAQIQLRNQLDALRDLTRAELQAQARTLGLHVAGSKGEILERIEARMVADIDRELADAAPPLEQVARVEHGTRVHPLVELWQRERTHLRKVCADALRAGVDERRVRLAEQDGTKLVAAIRGILDDLDLTPEQLARVPQIVPARLRDLVQQQDAESAPASTA